MMESPTFLFERWSVVEREWEWTSFDGGIESESKRQDSAECSR